MPDVTVADASVCLAWRLSEGERDLYSPLRYTSCLIVLTVVTFTAARIVTISLAPIVSHMMARRL